ncbi:MULTISPECIES: carboxylate-amine ligase [Streptomyces]|uniref:carboxylate-amine ligase n=1 Tax=Streptomyces TaxID=1883 RepID=UPI001670DC11|nr:MULTISPECIES: glutamate--cysteine ligase [Streptomyces]UFR00330.1 glutamate--cysteine ligase [Streptomyces sp. Go40/10]GGS81699.1 putative glutamate--cysteine ligase 2 [Streptomyces cinerochromogenes]
MPEPLDAVTPAAAGTPVFPAELTAPPTVGVEEEFVLADRHSRAAVHRAPAVVGAARGRLGAPHATAEVSQAQVETVSAVCRTAEDLAAEIVRLRGGAAVAAAEYDCLLVPSGTAVLGRPGPPPIVDKARYRAFARRFGPLAHDQGVNACHVHVGVDDREEAVRAVNHLRGWMPLLLAVTCNSPFSDGTDTGYASWRSMLWGRWPVAGPPPFLHGAAHHERVVGQLVASGAAMDPAMVYWHVRPSPHLPTVEVRVADVLPEPAATTAYALLVRALVGCAVDAVRAGEPAPVVPDLLLRAACWQAARYGTQGTLPATHTPDCAPTAVGRLVDELWKRVEPHLTRYGDDRWVGDWLSDVQREGTGSARQRRIADHHGGRLQSVVDDLAVAPG